MVSAAMSHLLVHKLLSIHGLVANEDSTEKEMQKITSEVILQDFYLDANGVDSEKLKKAMIKCQASLKSDERSKIIDSRRVISMRPGSDGTSDLKARFVVRGFRQFIEDPDLIYAATPHMSLLKLLLTVAAQKQWKITMLLWMSQRSFMSSLLENSTAIQEMSQRYGDSTKHL
eukprot:189112-Amphidinium_carterae.1